MKKVISTDNAPAAIGPYSQAAVVVESCEKVIKENDESIDVTEETEISRENGIDSVGIVTVICDIEEQLEIQLDEYLSYVRKCKTIGELVSVVEKAVGNQ